MGQPPTGRASALTLACIVSLALAAGPAPDAATLSEQPPGEQDTESHTPIHKTVIEPATPETPRSDTASVAQLSDGRLMVVYHKYEAGNNAGHDDGKCRIWSKVSADGGRSWAEPRMLVDVAPGDVSVMMPAIRRLRSGDLLLIANRIHAPYASATTMLLLRSQDDGATFQEQPPIWERDPAFPIQGGASSLLELDSGRLLVPFHAYKPGPKRHPLAASCLYSDDEGRSWTRSETTLELPLRGAMEASVAQLPDGLLIMSLRAQLGGPFISRSSDRGRTWSLPQPSGLVGGESCTCLRRLPGSGDLVLFWCNSVYQPRHHHFGERQPLSAALSRDGGRTWRKIGDVETGRAEYTNLDCLFTSSGEAVLTYMHADPAWNRDRIELRAAVIPPDWFRGEPERSRSAARRPGPRESEGRETPQSRTRL